VSDASDQADYRTAYAAIQRLIAARAAGAGVAKLLGDLGALIVRGLAPPLLPRFRAAIGGWLAGVDTPGPDALVDAVVLGAIDTHGSHVIEAVATALDSVGEASAAGATP